MSLGINILPDLKFTFSNFFDLKRTRSLYIGYTGYGNLGDEALREAIYELFKSKILFSESRGILIRSLEKMGVIKFNVLFLGGGTLVLRSQDVLNRISDKNIAKKIIFGTGVANHIFWKDVSGNYGDMQKWIDVLNNIDYVSIRGPISEKTLRDRGFNKHVEVVGDPVLFFTRDIKAPKTKSKKLGLNIGTTGGGKKKDLMWGRNEELFFLKFIEFTKAILADGWELEFIPVNKEDEIIIDGLLVKHLLNEKISVFRDYMNTQHVIDRMETFDVFIGQKLHATILAYCANTPAIMVEYRPKCRDFMASIGLEKYNIRTDEFNAERGKGLVEELYANLEPIRTKSNSICKEYKQKLIRAAQSVADILRSNV